MSTILDVTSPEFRGLLNPYTGEEIKVKMLVPPNGAPLFFAPDTYSTADRYPSRLEALREWSRKDGRYGLKSGMPVTCAYTGELLKPASDGSQAWLEGGFDPHVLRPRAEFLHFIAMRDGVSPFPAAPAPRVDAAPGAPPPEAGLSAAPDLSADALAVGEAVAESFSGQLEKKTVVRGFSPGKGKAGTAGKAGKGGRR